MAIKLKEILWRLEEIEARAAKATPGPWEVKSGHVESDDRCALVGAGKPIAHFYRRITPGGTFLHRRDCEFAASAREDVPWLCRVMRELIAQNAAMREPLEWLASIEECGNGFVVGDPINKEHVKHCSECQAILAARKALQFEAGRELWDRLDKLEKVAEAARVVTRQAQLQFDWEDLVDMGEFSDALEKLHQTLAAPEKVNDERRDPEAT